VVPQIIIWELFILGIFYSLVFFKQKTILVFGICMIIFGIGILRVPKHQYQNNQPEARPRVSLNQKFGTVINKNLSPPNSSILSAILLGNKQAISKQWKEKLNRAGIRHITAISGMHIAIISAMLLQLGIMLGLYRGQAFYFAVITLWLFIFMVGTPPSAVRAGIMGTMVLFAQKIGRQKSADRALLLTAGAMLAINPALLRDSIGFQLSFMAMLGIIYLMPFFQSLFSKLTFLKQAWGLVSMSLAAQIFVLPLLIYHFGQFSIISPITNLLIVPILPILMITGFLLVILGAIWLPLSSVFLFPTWLILSYITKLTNFFANLSFSTINFQIHWLWLPIIYALLGIFVWQIKKRGKSQFLT
jgi:competence protein ComEC